MTDRATPDGADPDARLSVVQALWLFAALTALKLWLNDFLRADGLAISEYGVVVGRDFANLWVGGKMVWAGKLAHLYDVDAYQAFMRGYFPAQSPHNYSYPPQTLLLGAVLAALPYPVALALWSMGGAALFLIAARPFVDRLPLLLVVVTPAALVNLWTGQYGFLTGALWLFAFGALDRSRLRSGIAAGLLAVKPHVGLLLPAIFLAKRRLRAIGIAIVVVAVTVAASGLLFGFDLWRDYVVKVPATQAAILASSDRLFYFKLMPTTLVGLRGLPEGVALAGQALTALAALALLWRARPLPAIDLAFVAATATMLILPYAFDYDMTVADLGFVVLLYGGWARLAVWEKAALGLAFVLPAVLILAEPLGLPLGPVVLLAALVVQVRHHRAAGAEIRRADDLHGGPL